MNELLFRIPLGEWVDVFVSWLTSTLRPVFSFISSTLRSLFDGVTFLTGEPAFWIVALVLAAVAFLARGWKLAVSSLVGFAIIYGVGQWENAMDSLAMVLIASVIAIVIAVPVGILAARSPAVSAVVRPVLDFMQTMPAFVYLLPAVVLFRVGVVPGIVATIIFAAAPGVRFTQLGIQQVDAEVVEAGHAFGATPRRILRQIQIPLALPTIMAGINQVIMLALSMVVIAGLVGGPGLGRPVIESLQRVDIGLGVEAGLSVVILAIFLDRVTAALGERAPVARAARARTAGE